MNFDANKRQILTRHRNIANKSDKHDANNKNKD